MCQVLAGIPSSFDRLLLNTSNLEVGLPGHDSIDAGLTQNQPKDSRCGPASDSF